MIIPLDLSDEEYQKRMNDAEYIIHQPKGFWCKDCNGIYKIYSVRHQRYFCLNCLIATWKKEDGRIKALINKLNRGETISVPIYFTKIAKSRYVDISKDEKHG